MQCKKSCLVHSRVWESPAVSCENAVDTGISQQDPAEVASEITTVPCPKTSRFMIPLPSFLVHNHRIAGVDMDLWRSSPTSGKSRIRIS